MRLIPMKPVPPVTNAVLAIGMQLPCEVAIIHAHRMMQREIKRDMLPP
jgi:hypothetical protein